MKTMLFMVLIAMELGLASTGGAQTTFTKVTEGELVSDLAGNFKRGSWGDFNNDGFLDVYVNDFGGTNTFFLNNRNGTFTRITQGDPVLPGAENSGTTSWADYDNDGNLDLLLPIGYGQAPTAGRVLLFHNNGDRSFGRVSGQPLTDQIGYFGGSWVDYDNDGFVDVLLYDIPDLSVGGRGQIWRNNGNGTFTKANAGAVANDTAAAWAFLWADYDNDGFPDLFVVNNLSNSQNPLYHNNRNGTFSRVLTNAIARDTWSGADSGGNGGCWGDYDNDGYLDLFVTARAGTQNRLYHNDGDGTFTKILSGAMLAHSRGVASVGCAWGDYDNDGYLDLFVSSFHGGNQLFHNNRDGTFSEILSGNPVLDGQTNTWYFGVSWVDYDNDGFLDLFVAGGNTDQGPGSNLLYHNDGNSNAWLEVKCVGTSSNRAGIGAKVRLRATIGGTAFWQLREINAGSGYSSAPLVAHFGLGDATNVEALRIEWPSGMVQELPDVPPRQILTVIEPERLTADIAHGLPRLTLKGGRGFEYEIQASTDLATWSVVGRLNITNSDGTAQFVDDSAGGSDRRFYRSNRR